MIGDAQAIAARKWRDLSLVAFDTETTGRYPLESEICEIAAVKWFGGEVIETFHTLIKPSRPMGDEVIAIHGITNAMVESAPTIAAKIAEFHSFIAGSVLVAHHAPFDMGFVAVEFDRAGLTLPSEPVLCSSLLSRKLFPQSENHRLQTLIKYFNLPQGAAHRALDDAEACLRVALNCLEKTGAESVLLEALDAQGGALNWPRFSLEELKRESRQSEIASKLINAIQDAAPVSMVYGGGTRPGEKRRVRPIGIVRSLDGDFVVAIPEGELRSKRYFLGRVQRVD